MTIKGLYDRVKQLDTDQIIEESMASTKDALLELNKDQLFEGKLSTGADITPSYLDDPYFKTREAAQRYSDWKDRITPHSNRKKGTPNLFINGYLHNSFTVEVTGSGINFNTSASFGNKVVGKYGDNIWGLNATFKAEYLSEFVSPLIKEKITSVTGLKFGS
jgi:hypothetical protein